MDENEQIFGGDKSLAKDKVDQEPLSKDEEHRPQLPEEESVDPADFSGELRICNTFRIGNGQFKLLFDTMNVVDGSLEVPDGVIQAFSAPMESMGEAMILSMSIHVKDGKIKTVTQDGQFPLSQAIAPPGGPGTELKRIIKRFFSSKVCGKCTQLARQMDRNGCDWCKENIPYITTEMEKNAKLLNAPYAESVAIRCVNIACWLAKRKGMCEPFG